MRQLLCFYANMQMVDVDLCTAAYWYWYTGSSSTTLFPVALQNVLVYFFFVFECCVRLIFMITVVEDFYSW